MMKANLVPVVASNRVGREDFSDTHINFYGSSFIADQTGEIVEQCAFVPSPGHEDDGAGAAAAVDGLTVAAKGGGGGGGGSGGSDGEFVMHTFDLESTRLQRAEWGLFRDRRPSLYRPLLSLDGRSTA